MFKLTKTARFAIAINIALSLVFQPLLFLPGLQATEPGNRSKLGMVMSIANSDWGYDVNHPGNAADPSDPVNIASIRAGTVKRAKDDLRIDLWEKYEQWGQIETNPGVYDFDRASAPYALSTDYTAQLASENNMGLSLRILTPFGRSESVGILPPDITFSRFNEVAFKTRYKNFLLALINRYETKGSRGIIKYLWIGVEVDRYFYKIYRDSRKTSDVATSKQVLQNKINDFIFFLNYIKQKVKADYPNIKIGTITTYHSSSMWNDSDTSGYFSGLNDIVVPVHQASDVIGYTYYHKLDDPPGSMKTGGPPVEAVQALQSLLGFTVVNFLGKKVYLTETGWNTVKSYDLQKGEEEQNQYIGLLFSLLRNYPNYIEAMAYRAMTDMPVQEAQDEARNEGVPEELVVNWAALYLQNFGLRNEEGLPKPAYIAWMTHAPRLVRQTTSEQWQAIKNNAKFNIHDPSFNTPQNVGLPINTGGWEDSANISADGKTLLLSYVPYDHVSSYFLGYPTISGPPSDFGNNDMNCHIYISTKKEDGKWSNRRLFDNSIQTDSEGGAQMSYDKQKIFFQRERVGTDTKSDFWVSKYDKADSKWLKATKMSEPPNSAEAEGDIAISKNEDEMIFERLVNGNNDLFVSKKDSNGNWQTPQNLGAPINTATANEFQPFLSWDGKELYFTSNRDGAGAIYRSVRADKDSPWQAPEILIEGADNIYGVGEATLTEDGKYLYFIAAYESRPLPLQNDFVEYDTDVMYVRRNNRAPVFSQIKNKSINEGSNLNFNVKATDVDGDALSYSAQNLPAGATFTGNTFNWTPSYSQAGYYNINFLVSDGSLTDNEQIVIIVADTAVDSPPSSTQPVIKPKKNNPKKRDTIKPRTLAAKTKVKKFNKKKVSYYSRLYKRYRAKYLKTKNKSLKKRFRKLAGKYLKYYRLAKKQIAFVKISWHVLDQAGNKALVRISIQKKVELKRSRRYQKLYKLYKIRYRKTRNRRLSKHYKKLSAKYKKAYLKTKAVYKTVNIVNYGWTLINKWRSYTFKTRTRGKYRYLVYAEDNAGNTQQNVAKSYFRVR